jgi:hypothetical protein
MMPQAAGIFLEIGTLRPLKVLNTLMGEDWLYHEAPKVCDFSHPFKQQLRKAFCPDDIE